MVTLGLKYGRLVSPIESAKVEHAAEQRLEMLLIFY